MKAMMATVGLGLILLIGFVSAIALEKMSKFMEKDMKD